MKYDYKKVRRIRNSLGIPKYIEGTNDLIFDLSKRPFERYSYSTFLSPRGVGKTTELLINGLIMYVEYGCQTCYLRTFEKQTTESLMITVYQIINHYGYVEKLTNGKYNQVIYKRNTKKFHLALCDEEMNVITMDNTPCCHVLAVELADKYKSSFNAPDGNWIIYDEAIEKFYHPWIYERFMDLLSTIIRKRPMTGEKPPHVFISANTLDRDYQLFKEMCVDDVLQLMNIGDAEKLNAGMETTMYIEIVSAREKEKNTIENLSDAVRQFFGFPNKKLEAIRGLEWVYEEFLHPPKNKNEYQKINTNCYIKYFNTLLKLDLILYGGSTWLFIHRATKTYDDSIIYTNEIELDNRYRYKFGDKSKVDKLIRMLINKNKIVYGDNRSGVIFNKYIKESRLY